MIFFSEIIVYLLFKNKFLQKRAQKVVHFFNSTKSRIGKLFDFFAMYAIICVYGKINKYDYC